MITKILSLTIAALTFCSVSISAAAQETKPGTMSSSSGGSNEAGTAQTTKKSTVSSQPYAVAGGAAGVGVVTDAKQGMADQQVSVLDQPLSKEELKYSGLLSQAQFAYEQKDYNQALAVLHRAYEMKQEPFVAGNIASIYMITGDAPNCVRIVRKTKLSDPSVIGGLILGLVDRGMLYYAKNIADMTDTMQDNGNIAYSKGVMYERLREPQTAEQYYRRAVMMSSHNPSYVYALARINDILKNYEKALTLYEDVLALTRRGDIYIHSVSRVDELRQMLKIDN